MRDGAYLSALPMELHIRIRSELIKDPDTRFYDFKTLRLVCKAFNLVWSPVVLSKIVLFPLKLRPGRDHHRNVVKNFRHVVHDINNLAVVQTVTLKGWHCLSIDTQRCICRRLFSKSKWEPVRRMLSTLTSAAVAPPTRLARLMANPGLFEARQSATELPNKMSLPNVHHVKMYIEHCENNWVISLSTRLLLALPSLTQLDLYLSPCVDMPYVSRCLAGLHTLQKFRLENYHSNSCSFYGAVNPVHMVECCSLIIAANPRLTHISLRFPRHFCPLSELLRHVPPDRPLKLEHLSLCDVFWPSEEILPHIRSLKSFLGLGYNLSNWCKFFAEQGVTPHTIHAYIINKDVIHYLERHPGVIGLELSGVQDGYGSALFRVLAQHSQTLRSLVISSRLLAEMLQMHENKTNFLQCTRLQELVLLPYYRAYPPPVAHYVNKSCILPPVAQLGPSLTVVITNDRGYYQRIVEHCRTSEDELVRDLAGRLVFEEQMD